MLYYILSGFLMIVVSKKSMPLSFSFLIVNFSLRLISLNCLSALLMSVI
jgi:hypothetical protein